MYFGIDYTKYFEKSKLGTGENFHKWWHGVIKVQNPVIMMILHGVIRKILPGQKRDGCVTSISEGEGGISAQWVGCWF